MTAAEREQHLELTRRLAEAEATIAALLSGEIDAVVDAKSQTPVLLAKAQAALREERDRAQRYLDTPDVILLALDSDCRVTLINRYACSLLGWSAKELIGQDWVDTCLPIAIRRSMRETIRLALTGGNPSSENAVLSRSGEERMILWRNTVLRDDDGRAIGTFSSGADITDRHDATEELRRAEERTRFALEASRIGIWDLDCATGSVQWSKILEEHYGLEPGTFAGTFAAFAAGIHPDDRAATIEIIDKASRVGAEFAVPHRAILPNGTVRWLAGRGRFLLGDDGKPTRGLGVLMDVTDRHTLEAQFQQAQKMEAVGRLAGGVAHDFNNLLTVILGFCELLAADLAPDDRHRVDIAEIQKAGMSAALLTRQLLAFSRKELIAPTLLDLNQVVGNMRAMLGRLIGEDINVIFVMRPEVATVIADRSQVEQVVMNLSINARDAMPRGGTLTIETANVELDDHYAAMHLGATPGHYVVLTVTDTGTGMTPEVQARLFEPFFTTKEVGKGTGLGLASVYGVATRSGGSVGVYSELGQGTSFKVYFPSAAAAADLIAVAAPAAPAPAASQTILVVEDQDGLRELARRLLARQGYTVLVAADASEARRLFDSTPSIDLVLTDVVMPGASGPDMIRELVDQRPALKVVYMSGYTEEAIAHHGVLNPGIAFLNKPFTAETLGAKIREVLAK